MAAAARASGRSASRRIWRRILPNHPLRADAGPATGIGPVAAAPFGSALILPITYAYIRMMGAAGPEARDRGGDPERQLRRRPAARRISRCSTPAPDGMVAHECIIDCRGFAAEAGVQVEDIAKRLQDFGFHAPTMSWPVRGHADDRADRKRVEGGTRPVLRRDDRDPRRKSPTSPRAGSTAPTTR